MEISKIPNGVQSIKFFSQMTEKRMLVRRVKLLSKEDLQMCISEKFLAIVSNVSYELVEVWDWRSVTQIIPNSTSPEEFTLVLTNSKHKFLSQNRSYLLCLLSYYKSKSTSQNAVTYSVKKVKPSGKIIEMSLQVRSYGVVQMPKKADQKEKIMFFSDILKIIPLNDSNSLAFIHEGNEFEIYTFNDIARASADIIAKTKALCIQLQIVETLPMEDLLETSNVRKAEAENSNLLGEVRAMHGQLKPEKIVCFTENWFIERDAASYNVTFAKNLNLVQHIYRGNDGMEVTVSFTDGTERMFLTTQRENFIVSLYDCVVAAKGDPIISDMKLFGSLVIDKMTAAESGKMELSLLKNLSNFDGTKITGIDPTELFMVYVFLFNNNVSPSGLLFEKDIRSKLITKALEKLIFNGKAGEGYLQCLQRLLGTNAGYEMFVENKAIQDKVIEVLIKAMGSAKSIIVFWALKVIVTLLNPKVEEDLEKRGKLVVLSRGVSEEVFSVLEKNIKNGEGLLVYGTVNVFRYVVCEPYSSTTEFAMFNKVMGIISKLGRNMFALFQSPSISVPQVAGEFLRALVEETDMEEAIKELQDYALLEGITLQYLQISCFLQAKTTTQMLQKYLAIHLLDVFTAGHDDSEAMLKRTVPLSLLAYLDSTEEPPEKVEVSEVEKKSVTVTTSMFKSFLKKWNFNRNNTTQAEIRTRRKKTIKQRRNWEMFVYQLHQQHRRADLIWNHQTRQELQEALEQEIRSLKKDQEEGEVAWNHREFLVEYHSLDNEVCVDGCYIRCLLERPDLKLNDPHDFFDILYHRCLFETNRELQALSIQAMCVIYSKFSEQVGSFKDIVHIISMLRTTRSLLLRDRLIALIRSLLKVEINARKFIDVGGIDLYVELLTLVHLHSDHAIIPLQTNLLTAGVASGEWFYAEMFEEKKVKKGPVSIDQLKVLVMNKTLDEDILVWAQGMEDWKPLKDVTVLKWAILQEDTGVLTPLLFCQEIIGTLEELVTMYPSRDMNGILLRPIPRAKRLLSSPRHLPHVVQLLLTACPQIIDTSARLLKNLLEDNPPAQPKFYLTGAFLFSLMYAGSNIKEIAKLLAATHRQQRVGDAVELSALKSMLPGSLITVIDRSPDEFAARFVGEVATPEIRWGSSMRNYLIDTIAQHLGDFPSRLGSNPLAVYSFVPIAPLVYEELKGELYCGKIYLNQLCDVEKYPDFVISDPVGLLQSILRTWVELAEEPQKMSTSEACKVLGIENPDDKSKLRKAYFKLAQKYHPDRNPEGREMFEKVNEAYNQLVESGPDESSNKIAIILQSQCILYSRCIEDLSPYKYAGYGLLIPCLKDADLMSRSLELIYLTIRSSTLNVQELGRLGGMKGLLTILDVLCTEIKDDKVNDIRYILRACAVASKYEETITEIKKDTGMLGNLKKCLSSENLALVEASLECVTCYSTCDESIRKDMYAKNFLGILVHRVMGYDPTLEDQSEQTDQQSIHQMKNAIAGMSLLALKALVKIEENNEETQGVFALFTPQVGMKMRTKPVTEVLRIINSTTQTPYLLWTNKMRSELVDYVDAHLSGTLEWQPKEYALYKFPSLEKELVITSIYVRIFNEQIRTCEKLVDPMIFLRGLVTRKDLQGEWLKQQCQAIANVFEQYDIAVQFCENSELLEALFSMLKEDPEDLAVQEALLRSVKRLVSNSSCVEVIANSKVLPKFLVLLYPSGLLTQIIPLAQTVFSIMIGLQQGILRGGLLYLMNHFVNGTDLDQRVLVSQLMGKMSTTPSVGPKVTLSLGKFFPAAIVNAIKMDARGAVLLLDSTAETAELIWNPEMKRDVGQFINKMAVAFHTKCQSDPSVKWQVPDSFSFAYKELKDEIYIGGVFIRILNKNPSSPLNNPNLFTDGLFAKYFEARRDGKVDDMKMLATTAAVFYTNQPQNLEYVAGAGHLSKVIEALQMTPDETLFIILQVLVTNKKCKENLLDNNAVPLTAMCLTKVVEHNNLVADVFRSLTASYNCRGVLCFVPRLCNAAVQKNIFSVLDGSLDEKMGTTSPEIKAMVVDAVQNALTDYDHSTELNEILNQNPIWKLYSTQKHGLFLSGASSIAGYIAGPTSSGAVGLLTAAEDSSVKRPDAPPDLQ